MKNRFSQAFAPAVLVISIALAMAASAQEEVLFDFSGPNGYGPTGNLVADSKGNLYGTTGIGGNIESNCSAGCGVVFKLTPTTSGTWKETVLYSFTGETDGYDPYWLALDSTGNLYGITQIGGEPTEGTKGCIETGCGTLFRLSEKDGTVTYTLLHAFTGKTDGYHPAGVSVDTSGNVFVTVNAGAGESGYGVIYEMVGGKTGRTIYTFNNSTGAEPDGPALIDASGDLYGTTFAGGANGLGVVYELVPGSGGTWNESVLYSFATGDGGYEPSGNLAFDSSGNLYGAMSSGGASSYGVVFELAPNSEGSWTESVLYAFNGTTDGQSPTSGVVMDGAGNLYGTTQSGGDPTCNCGTLWGVSPSASGWSETTLQAFTGGADGSSPSQVLLDSDENLFGDALEGTVTSSCSEGCGLIYEFPGVGASVSESRIR
jgi:uncharacterized repeat protein (TIGR03803 family)